MSTLTTLKCATLSQTSSAYTEEQHLVWNKLFERQLRAINGRACKEFMVGLEMFEDLIRTLPSIEILSAQLNKLVGWKLIPVSGLIEPEEYYLHLASKEFPVATHLRSLDNFDYSSTPDLWHDVFGHLPLLTFTLYSNFVEYIGKKWIGGNNKQRYLIDKLYWYTIEAGVCRENGQRKVYGASQLSSYGEIHYALSVQPIVRTFDMKAVIQLDTKIDEFQNNLLEIPAFEYLAQVIDEVDLIFDNQK